MGMAGDGEDAGGRQMGKNIGLVRQAQHILLRQAGQGFAAIRRPCPGVDARQDHRAIRPPDDGMGVVEHQDAGLSQCRRHAAPPGHIVMIAHHGIDAQWCFQSPQVAGDLVQRHAQAAIVAVADIIACQQDQVGPSCLGRGHHRVDLGRIDIGRAGMKVGNHSDAQTLERRCLHRQVIFGDTQAVGFPPDGIQQQRCGKGRHHDQEKFANGPGPRRDQNLILARCTTETALAPVWPCGLIW